MPRASQLVYTNVEEDRSPHRRRGFQLWLWSDDLSARPKVREEVEQRVNTFVRPDPKSAFVRHLFAPLAVEPLVMLAHAVPLDGLDKFGRGGRFHTHVLLIPKDEFAAAGADPFTFFDSGFAFQRDPADPSLDDALRAKSLPTVELHPKDPPAPADVPDAHRDLVRGLVASLLDPSAADTAALPLPVADVEAVARAVVRLLPPAARLRASFDTLWPGKGKHAPRVAGAGTPALLQVWMFRRFVRYDPVQRVFRPPPKATEWAGKLAGWWASVPEPSAADRECSQAVTAWLFADGPLPAVVTAPAAEWAEREFPQAVAQRWKVVKEQVVASAMPAEAVVLPGVREAGAGYLGAWGVDGVRRAGEGIPAVECVRWVAGVVMGGRRLDEVTAGAIARWRENDLHVDGVKLRTAVCRWIPKNLDYLCGELRAESPALDWLREYCRRTLPAEYRRPDAAVQATHRHMLAHAEVPAEAEVAEALGGHDGWPVEPLDRLRLLLRAGGRLGEQPDQFLQGRPHLFHWAAEHLLAAGTAGVRFVTLELPPHADNYWGHLFPEAKHPLALLGVRVPPAAGGLIALFARTLRLGFLARLDRRFDRRGYPEADEPAGVEKQPAWKKCESARRENKSAKLLAAVREAGDDVFRKLANDGLLPYAGGRWVCDRVWDDGGLFAGVAVELTNPTDNGRARPLLFALAGSVVPASAAGSEALPDADTDTLHRFAWLLVRLLDPAGTTRLGFPRATAIPSDTR